MFSKILGEKTTSKYTSNILGIDPNNPDYDYREEWVGRSRRINPTPTTNYDQQKKLERQIQDLNSILTFLRSSLDNPLVSAPPFSDVVLVASDDPTANPIPANRAILASRSPVFQAMLEAQMAESITGTINVGEVSHDTLGVFVTFLYSGEANDLDEKMARDILGLADKYQVSHIKGYCEKFLISKLNWINSLPIYACALQHNADSLAAKSLSLISANLNKLLEREDYAEFAEKDPA